MYKYCIGYFCKNIILIFLDVENEDKENGVLMIIINWLINTHKNRPEKDIIKGLFHRVRPWYADFAKQSKTIFA